MIVGSLISLKSSLLRLNIYSNAYLPDDLRASGPKKRTIYLLSSFQHNSNGLQIKH